MNIPIFGIKIKRKENDNMHTEPATAFNGIERNYSGDWPCEI